VSNSVEELLEAIDRIARELPPATIHGLAAKLDSIEQPIAAGELTQLGATQPSQQLLRSLEALLMGNAAPRRSAVALALRSSLFIGQKRSDLTRFEIAWTGLGTAAVPVRRVDQVMYELINGAQREVVLASYVTHGAEGALDALRSATDRSVDVTLILERAEETGGKLAFDGLGVIKERVPNAEIYYWPLEKRGISKQGRSGILHAKCLVCDAEHALVSSANLTDQGLELNMELGLVLHGGDIPKRLTAHFRQLVYQGELRKLERD